jgi:hypothetical protein
VSERPIVYRQPAVPAYDSYRWEQPIGSPDLLMGNLREHLLRAVAEGVPDDAVMIYSPGSLCFFWRRAVQ